MLNMDHSAISAILTPYGVHASEELTRLIRAYSELLLRWNQKIALTTVTDPAEVVRFHFGESLFAASLLPPLKGRLADLGSGAGFPGLALKLIAPNLHVSLIESNVKKSAFLAEVVRALNLRDLEVFRGRLESYPIEGDSFNFVTARALGSFEKILNWASKRLSTGDRIALWVGREDAAALGSIETFLWSQPALIPGTKNRYILVGSPKE